MNPQDHVAIKASNAAEMLLRLTNFELGYVAGVLAENHPGLAQQLGIALKLNLEDIYGNKFPIA